MKTNFRAWSFLIILSAAFLLLGQWVGGRQGLLLGFIFALTLNFYLYFASDKKVLRFFKAKQIEGQDPWGLSKTVRLLSQKVRMAEPQIYVTPLKTPTAFSLGQMWGKSKLIVSQGLLDQFSEEELKVVLTLQAVHLQKLHNLTSGISGQLAELIFLAAYGLDGFINFINVFTRRTPYFFQNLLTPLGNALIRMNMSSNSFSETDQTAAKLVGSKELLAEVLWKLHSHSTTQPIQGPPTSAPYFVVSPLTQTKINRYFQTHPSIELRLQNLLGHYPL